MRSWALIGALGALWITAACGSSSHNSSAGQGGSAGTQATGGSAGKGNAGTGTGGGGTAAPIALEDLCPIFTHDLCIYLMECNGARYEDAEHCERELDCFGLQELTAAAEAGAVDYDPSQVGACHERFIESPCTFGFFLFTPDIYEVLRYCPGTITPKLQAGESCSSTGECSEGLYCYKGIDYQCPGQCQAFSQEGEDCAGSASCIDELDCQNDVCVPEKKAGDACGDGCNYSLSCPDDEVCPGNIWCDQELDQCQSGRLVDEECGFLMNSALTSYAPCAVHLWCDAAGVGSGVCHARSAEGGPCNDEFSACQEGLHCVGYDIAGDPGTFGSCEPPSSVGGDCGRQDDCQAGLSCVAAQCREPGAEGADCDDSDDCQAGLVCPNLLCVTARYPGDACDDASSCTLGRCVDGVCDYHLKVGEPCTASTDCATGYCIDGVCYDGSVCNAPEP